MSDDPRTDVPARRWRFPFGWLGLVLLGWVVYELTQSPALGSVLVCLKFGWEDALTARWLWREDAKRWRRAATFWLYLAWGLWKVGMVAFFMSAAFAVLVPRGVAPANLAQVLGLFVSTFLLTLICFGLSTLMTFLALFYAWCGGVRLWLGSAVHRARRNDDWPPTPWCEGKPNRLGTLVLTSLGLSMITGVMTAVAINVPGVGLAGSVCAPVAVGLAYEVVTRFVWANRAAECWPEDDSPLASEGPGAIE